jgi:hypothetical protein
MDALNGTTLWTWNAIGKRKGAWALDKDAPEATRGLPAQPPDRRVAAAQGRRPRWANSDPITGQAAWFDLRVSIRRDPDQANGQSLPDAGAQNSPVGPAPANVAFGRGKAR